jgi:hypothetical protein
MRENMSRIGVLASHAVRHPGHLVQTVGSLRDHPGRRGSLIAWCAAFGPARTVRISRRIEHRLECGCQVGLAFDSGER